MISFPSRARERFPAHVCHQAQLLPTGVESINQSINHSFPAVANLRWHP